MCFDTSFFNELRNLNGAALAPIIPNRYRPTVPEIYDHGDVSYGFLDTTVEFVKELNRRSRGRESFSFEFRANQDVPRHIYNYTKGRAFRKQLNVAFSAGDDENGDCVRIGLGFSLNQYQKMEGIDDYGDFIMNVASNPSRFDSTFAALGSYGEPDHVFSPALSSAIVMGDNPDFRDDWRFYGKLLYFNENQSQISNMDAFVDEVIGVFKNIRAAGFYP